MKYCKKCNLDVDVEGLRFCPTCKGLLIAKEMQGRKEPDKPLYTEKNPPAAATVYCKWKNIPYETFAYNLHSGAVSSDFVILEYKFKEGGHFHCSNCAYWLEGFCTLKKRDCAEDAICKSYEKHLNPGAKLQDRGIASEIQR
jgi:hypothetical protein